MAGPIRRGPSTTTPTIPTTPVDDSSATTNESPVTDATSPSTQPLDSSDHLETEARSRSDISGQPPSGPPPPITETTALRPKGPVDSPHATSPEHHENLDKLKTDSFLLADLNLDAPLAPDEEARLEPIESSETASTRDTTKVVEITEAETFGDDFDSRWEMIDPSSLRGLTPRSPDEKFNGPPLTGDPIRMVFRLKEPAPGRKFMIRVPGPELSLKDAMRAQSKNCAKILDRLGNAGLGRFGKIELSDDGNMNIHNPSFTPGSDLHAAYGTTASERLEFTSDQDAILHQADGTSNSTQKDFFKNREFKPRWRETPSEGTPSQNEAQALAKYIRKACSHGNVTVRDDENPVRPSEPTVDPQRKEAIKTTLDNFVPIPSIEAPYLALADEVKAALEDDDPRIADIESGVEDIEGQRIALQAQLEELDAQFAELTEALDKEDADLETLEDRLAVHLQNRTDYTSSVEGFNEAAEAYAEVLRQTLKDLEDTTAATELETAKGDLKISLEGLPKPSDTNIEYQTTYATLQDTGDRRADEDHQFAAQVQALNQELEAITQKTAQLEKQATQIAARLDSSPDTGALSKEKEKIEGLEKQLQAHEKTITEFNANSQTLQQELQRALEGTLKTQENAKLREELATAKEAAVASLQTPVRGLEPGDVFANFEALQALGASDVIEKMGFGAKIPQLQTTLDTLIHEGAELQTQQERLLTKIEEATDIETLNRVTEKIQPDTEKLPAHNDAVGAFNAKANQLNTLLLAAIADTKVQQETIRLEQELATAKEAAVANLQTPVNGPEPGDVFTNFEALQTLGASDIIEKLGFGTKVPQLQTTLDTLMHEGAELQTQQERLLAKVGEATDIETLNRVTEKIQPDTEKLPAHNDAVSSFNTKANQLNSLLLTAIADTKAQQEALQEAQALAESISRITGSMDSSSANGSSAADFRQAFEALVATKDTKAIEDKGFKDKVEQLSGRESKLAEDKSSLDQRGATLRTQVEQAPDQETLAAVGKKVEEWQSSVAAHNNNISHLEEEATLLTDKINAVTELVKKTAADAAKRKALSQAKTVLEKRKGAIPPPGDPSDSYATAMAAFIEHLGNDRAQETTLPQEVETLSTRKSELTSQGDALQATLEELAINISRASREGDLLPLQEKVERLENETASLNQKISDFNQDSDGLAGKIQEAQQQKLAQIELNQQMGELSTELQTQLGAIPDLVDLNQDYREALETLIQLVGTAASLEQEATSLSERSTELSTNGKSVTDERAQLLGEIQGSHSLDELTAFKEKTGDLVSRSASHASDRTQYNSQASKLMEGITAAIDSAKTEQAKTAALNELRATTLDRFAPLDFSDLPINGEVQGVFQHFVQLAGKQAAEEGGFALHAATLDEIFNFVQTGRSELLSQSQELRAAMETAPDQTTLDELTEKFEALQQAAEDHRNQVKGFNGDASTFLQTVDKALRAILDAPTIDIGQFVLNTRNPLGEASYVEIMSDISKLSDQLQNLAESTDDPAQFDFALHEGLSRFMERNRTRLAQRHNELTSVYELPPFRTLATILHDDLLAHGTRLPVEHLAKGGSTEEGQKAYAQKLTAKHSARLDWLMAKELESPHPIGGQAGTSNGARALKQCSRFVDTNRFLSGAIRGATTALPQSPSGADQALLKAVNASRNSKVAESYGDFVGYKLAPGSDDALSQFANSKEKARTDSAPPGEVVAYRVSDDAKGAKEQIILLSGVGKLNGHPVKFEGHPPRTSLPGFSEKFQINPSVVRDLTRANTSIPFDHYLPLKSPFGRKMLLVNAGSESFAYEINRRNELSPVPLDGDPNAAIRARVFLTNQLLATDAPPAALIPHLGKLIHEDVTRLAPLQETLSALSYSSSPTANPLTQSVVELSLAALASKASGEDLKGLDDGSLETSFRQYLSFDKPPELQLHPGAFSSIAGALGVTHLANRVSELGGDDRQALLALYDDVKAPFHLPKSPKKRFDSSNASDEADFFGHVSHYIWTLSGSTGKETKSLLQDRVRLRSALLADVEAHPDASKTSSEHQFARSLGAKLLCLDPLRMGDEEKAVLRQIREPHSRDWKLALLNRQRPHRSDGVALGNGLRKLEKATAANPRAGEGAGKANLKASPASIHLEGGHLDTLLQKHDVMLKMKKTIEHDRKSRIDMPLAEHLVDTLATVHGDAILDEFDEFIQAPSIKIEFDFDNVEGLTPRNLHKKLNGQVFRYEEGLHSAQTTALHEAGTNPELKRLDLEGLSEAFLQGSTGNNAALNEALATVFLMENNLNQLRSIQEDVAGGLLTEGGASESVVSKALERLSGMERSYGLRDDKGQPGLGIFERRLLGFERMFNTKLRPSQYEMVKGITSEGKRFINCGTGFGKTFCLQLVIWNQLLDNRSKTDSSQKELVLIQPTENLKEKTRGDYASFGSRSEVNFTLLETPFAKWDSEWSSENLGETLTTYAHQLEKGRQDSNIAWLLSDADELSFRAHYSELAARPDRTEAQDDALIAMSAIMNILRNKADKFIDEHDNVLNPERVGAPGSRSLREITAQDSAPASAMSKALSEVFGSASDESLAAAGLDRSTHSSGGSCLHLTNAAKFREARPKILEAFCGHLGTELESISFEQTQAFFQDGTLPDEGDCLPEDEESLFNARKLLQQLPGLLAKVPGNDFVRDEKSGGAIRPVHKGALLSTSSFGAIETAFLTTQLATQSGDSTIMGSLEGLLVPDSHSSLSRQSLLDCHRVTGLSATEGNPSITAALTGQNSHAMYTDPSTTRPRLVYQLAKKSTRVTVATGEGKTYLNNLVDAAIKEVPDGADRPLLLVDGGGDLHRGDRHELVRSLYEKRQSRDPNYRVSFFTDDKQQWVFAGQTIRPYEASLDDPFAKVTDYYLPPALSEAGTDVRQVPEHIIVSTGISDLDNETQQIGRGRQLDKGQVLVKVLNQERASNLGVSTQSSPNDLKELYFDELIRLEKEKAPQTQRSSEDAIQGMISDRFRELRLPRLAPDVAHLLQGADDVALSAPSNFQGVSDGLVLGNDLGVYLTSYSQALWDTAGGSISQDLQSQYLDCLRETFRSDGISASDFDREVNSIVTEILSQRSSRLPAEGKLTLERLNGAIQMNADRFRVEVQKRAQVKYPRNMLKSIKACSDASSRRSVHRVMQRAKGPNSFGLTWPEQCGLLIEKASRASDETACYSIILRHDIL